MKTRAVSCRLGVRSAITGCMSSCPATPGGGGVSGELYIGGYRPRRGYIRPTGTHRARFVADPFGAPELPLSRTGDPRTLACRRRTRLSQPRRSAGEDSRFPGGAGRSPRCWCQHVTGRRLVAAQGDRPIRDLLLLTLFATCGAAELMARAGASATADRGSSPHFPNRNCSGGSLATHQRKTSSRRWLNRARCSINFEPGDFATRLI